MRFHYRATSAAGALVLAVAVPAIARAQRFEVRPLGRSVTSAGMSATPCRRGVRQLRRQSVGHQWPRDHAGDTRRRARSCASTSA